MRTILAVALVAGCTGDGSTDDTTTPLDQIIPPDDTSPPFVETGLEGGYVDASLFFVIPQFAYDEENERFASYAHPDFGLLDMALTVLFVDSSYLSTGIIDATNSCSVTLEFPGPRDNAPWVEPHGGWAGVDVPNDAIVRDGCRNYGMPGVFEGDAGKHVAKWRWGMGIGPLSQAMFEFLSDNLEPSQWAALEPYVVGASLKTSWLEGSDLSKDGFYGEGYGLGYEIDGNFQIVLGGTGNPEPIESQFINAPGGIATGYYEGEFGFQPGTILTAEPR